MLTPAVSLWTADQCFLTAAIVFACVWLAVARQRNATPAPDGDPADIDSPTRPATAPPSRLSRYALPLVLGAVAFFMLERGGNPIGVRVDSWSDANVVVSGHNYARYGIATDAAAAQHQWTTDANPPDPFYRYTQYPVLSNIINGVWQSIGITSVPLFRMLPAACSIAAVALWFSLFRRLVGRQVALFAAIIMATSYGFLAYADNLHFHGYALLSSAAAACTYVRAMDASQIKRLRWFALSGLFVFITALFTWEYHLWLVAFFGLYALLFRSPIPRWRLALLAIPLFAALALQVTQKRLAMADVQVARTAETTNRSTIFDDIKRRTIGFDSAIDTPPGLSLSGYPQHLLLRYYKFYGIPAIAAAAMIAMLFAVKRRTDSTDSHRRNGAQLTLVLLLSGAAWWLVMMQHTAVHAHVMRHALAGYALMLALVFCYCWRTVRSPAHSPATRLVAIGLLVILAGTHIEGSVANVRLHQQYNYMDTRERCDAGQWESQLLSQLRSVIPNGAVILTNHNRLAPMRLWSQRPVYWARASALPQAQSGTDRTLLDMSFSHLRRMYNDNIPDLYYVYTYWVPPPALAQVFKADPFLRYLVLGTESGGPAQWRRAAPLLEEVLRNGGCSSTYCPAVAAFGNLIVFDLSPAVPTLRKRFGSLSPPTLREYGPPR